MCVKHMKFSSPLRAGPLYTTPGSLLTRIGLQAGLNWKKIYLHKPGLHGRIIVSVLFRFVFVYET